MKLSINRVNEWLVVILVLIIFPFTFDFIRGGAYFFPDNLHYLFNTYPSVVITGLDSKNAISLFSGEPIAEYAFSFETLSILLSVWTFLVIGPYLFYRGYKSADKNKDYRKPWYWYIGAAIVIGGLSVWPQELLHMRVFENSMDSQMKSRESDMMRSELATVSFATAEYEIAGEGIDSDFELDDLNLGDMNYLYKIESISGDSLIVISVHHPNYSDLSKKMEIRPYQRNALRLRN